MKIVVNIRGGHVETGMSFIRHVFTRLVSTYAEHQFIFIADPEELSWLPASENVTIPDTGNHLEQPILTRWWHYYSLPNLLKKYGADLLINVNGTGCLRTSIPQVLMLGDETCLKFKRVKKHASTNLLKKNISRSNLVAYIKKASCVLVVSQYAKQELIRLFETDKEKIIVTGQPTGEQFQPVSWEQKEIIKKEVANGKEYFLYEGAISPDQNIITLLKAFSLFKKRQLSNMQLLLAGNIRWPGASFTERLAKYKFRDDVQVISEVSGSMLAKITGSAYAMIVPSKKPGFNLASAHAISCGVPVISASVQPEPGADVVLSADADNAEEIANQMKLLYKDENFRSQLVAKGNEIREDFTVASVTDKVWNCITNLVQVPDLHLPS